MDVMIQTDPCATHNAIVTDNIFRAPAFRQLIANEFYLKPIQLSLQTATEPQSTDIKIDAFLRQNLLGKKTVIIGAGFDKTGIIPDLPDTQPSDVVETLSLALAKQRIQCLELRTTQRIPCLLDQAHKVELNVDIQSSVTAVWDNLSTNTRKNIRRPLKRGFSSTVGNSDALLEEFYQLYYMSLHDIGSLPHPKTFFVNLLAQCHENIAIFVGYMDGIPVVSSLSFTSATEVYGAWSGIHTDYKKHNVFLAMLWQMVEYCGETGRQTYNLGRSTAGSNPHQFKLKLANRVHKIYYYQIPLSAPNATPSRVQTAASWLIRHTPSIVMDGLARTLMHRFY